MALEERPDEIDGLLNQVFAATPLLFVRAFLREQKRHSKRVKIGENAKDVRENLRDALIAQYIGRKDLEAWLHKVEGWGKQHLYLSRVPKRSLTHAHLLNVTALRNMMKKKGLFEPDAQKEARAVHSLDEVSVDDEVARISWRSHSIDRERRKDLDRVEEYEDGEYEFQAYRRNPRRSASRLIVRKTDGIVLLLVDLPEGDDHDAVRSQMESTADVVVAPLARECIFMGPIVSALDQGAVAGYGPRAKRNVSLGVSPTQARYRADGAQLEFRSTRDSAGYADSEAVRHVRNAMQITRFEGEAGKFRLKFEGPKSEPHDMVVSLNASRNHVYLFSRMEETEVLALVDQLVGLV